MTEKIKVGIIRGGTGGNYASSLKKGGNIISHINENLSDKYKTVDIFIDKNGNWHANGLPIIPADLVRKVDIVWDTSEHPSAFIALNNFSIPNLGRGHFLKVLENNNDMLRKHMKEIGVQMPRSMVLPLYQKDFDGLRERYVIKKAKEIFEKFSSPWVVKSFTPDSNMGIHLVKTFPELVDAIEDGVKHEKSILVEEFIDGKVASIHSVSSFRGQDIYIFPLKDISIEEKVPTPKGVGILTESVGKKINDIIKNLHKHLAVEYYLKSNFIFHPRRGFFLTDIDFLPDLRDGSHFEESCEFVGAKMHHVVEHILEKALNKKI